ncbi:MAG: SUMF1/EgtB/PvdO family nonheme iron enzyme [Chloroflexota bacterium]
MTASQKGRIFISYRRVDSGGYAGRIYDRLAARFGEDAVFMDVDDIPAGLDFVEVLQNAVQSCDALAALIGRNWLDARDEAGGRRLDNPEDFVRVEIAAALERGIRVIPVLVDGAPMPRASDLPENLKPLARRNAVQVNHHSFNADAYHLIEQLELALKAAEDSKLLKARVLQEEQERKRVESREQAERTRLAAEEKARKEKEAREKKQAEEKARKDALKKTRQQETTERIKNIFRTGNKRPYFIGGGIVILFLFGYIIKNALAPTVPSVPTESAVTLALPSVTSIESPTKILPTLTFSSTPEPIITNTPEPTSRPTNPSSENPIVGKTWVQTIDGMTMVYVPAGEFQMGSNADEALAECQKFRTDCQRDWFTDEEPIHTVYLDAFWIDQTEVTNEMFAVFLNEAGNQNESGVTWLDSGDADVRIHKIEDTWQTDSGYGDHPVIEVSWYGAKAYCEWAGRRLPTEAEWEKAARGGLEGNVYPWGDEAPVCEKGAKNGAQYRNCAGLIAPVGCFGQNGYGLYDMAGNVLEWVSSLYQSYPYGAIDGREDLSSSDSRVLRGGSYRNYPYDLRPAARSLSNPRYSDYNFDFGFRCSRSAASP